jgi:hypothetical protein
MAAPPLIDGGAVIALCVPGVARAYSPWFGHDRQSPGHWLEPPVLGQPRAAEAAVRYPEVPGAGGGDPVGEADAALAPPRTRAAAS